LDRPKELARSKHSDYFCHSISDKEKRVFKHWRQAFLRMAFHSPKDLLSEVLHVSTVSSHVAGMLASGDLKIIVGALQLSEILLQKMPEEFGVHFRREGVLHQVSV
jgi:hypothetical protein